MPVGPAIWCSGCGVSHAVDGHLAVDSTHPVNHGNWEHENEMFGPALCSYDNYTHVFRPGDIYISNCRSKMQMCIVYSNCTGRTSTLHPITWTAYKASIILRHATFDRNMQLH